MGDIPHLVQLGLLAPRNARAHARDAGVSKRRALHHRDELTIVFHEHDRQLASLAGGPLVAKGIVGQVPRD